jgi:fatty-acid desaturase
MLVGDVSIIFHRSIALMSLGVKPTRQFILVLAIWLALCGESNGFSMVEFEKNIENQCLL